ncbi:AIG2-like family protein [Frankia sp. EI5c]|uniref:gamma-glutamylcyclotransferase family protein n=1 Tax=Frankia sp. EI5c TaxID=683316 RepID=UPI0007C30CE7|nr:gamma-glutamylcyclotransferase family protein [Frankia sp. EI5c]OAA26489.1 AIG2-like family protein [Frankia sp. EI5c]
MTRRADGAGREPGTGTGTGCGSRAGGAGAPPLFVYGTLRFPEVVETLLSRRPATTSAAVAGWRAAALRGRSYPGLVPAQRDVACAGSCLHDLTGAERELLDLFEGAHYEAREIPLVGGGHAVAYLWRGLPDPQVLPADWDPARFAAEHLADFVRQCREWRAQVVPGPPR